jgi:hypothetical protein
MIELLRNPTALLERQAALRQWYAELMYEKISEMEDLLIEKALAVP